MDAGIETEMKSSISAVGNVGRNEEGRLGKCFRGIGFH